MDIEADTNDLLLADAAKGDRAAFRTLYAKTSSRLFACCLALLRDRGRAEEALQEGFVRIWEHARSFDRDRGSALTWMTVVVRRVALNELRRRDTRHVSMDDEESGLPEFAADLPDQDPIGGARLKSCLGRLGEDRRKFVILAYLYGYTHEELAHRFDRPVGTMKSILFRALADLRKCIA